VPTFVKLCETYDYREILLNQVKEKKNMQKHGNMQNEVKNTETCKKYKKRAGISETSHKT